MNTNQCLAAILPEWEFPLSPPIKVLALPPTPTWLLVGVPLYSHTLGSLHTLSFCSDHFSFLYVNVTEHLLILKVSPTLISSEDLSLLPVALSLLQARRDLK